MSEPLNNSGKKSDYNPELPNESFYSFLQENDLEEINLEYNYQTQTIDPEVIDINPFKRDSVQLNSEEQQKNLFSYQLYSNRNNYDNLLSAVQDMHANNAENEENSISLRSENNKATHNSPEIDGRKNLSKNLITSETTSFQGNINLNMKKKIIASKQKNRSKTPRIINQKPIRLSDNELNSEKSKVPTQKKKATSTVNKDIKKKDSKNIVKEISYAKEKKISIENIKSQNFSSFKNKELIKSHKTELYDTQRQAKLIRSKVSSKKCNVSSSNSKTRKALNLALSPNTCRNKDQVFLSQNTNHVNPVFFNKGSGYLKECSDLKSKNQMSGSKRERNETYNNENSLKKQGKKRNLTTSVKELHKNEGNKSSTENVHHETLTNNLDVILNVKPKAQTKTMAYSAEQHSNENDVENAFVKSTHKREKFRDENNLQINTSQLYNTVTASNRDSCNISNDINPDNANQISINNCADSLVDLNSKSNNYTNNNLTGECGSIENNSSIIKIQQNDKSPNIYSVNNKIIEIPGYCQNNSTVLKKDEIFIKRTPKYNYVNENMLLFSSTTNFPFVLSKDTKDPMMIYNNLPKSPKSTSQSATKKTPYSMKYTIENYKGISQSPIIHANKDNNLITHATSCKNSIISLLNNKDMRERLKKNTLKTDPNEHNVSKIKALVTNLNSNIEESEQDSNLQVLFSDSPVKKKKDQNNNKVIESRENKSFQSRANMIVSLDTQRYCEKPLKSEKVLQTSCVDSKDQTCQDKTNQNNKDLNASYKSRSKNAPKRCSLKKLSKEFLENSTKAVTQQPKADIFAQTYNSGENIPQNKKEITIVTNNEKIQAKLVASKSTGKNLSLAQKTKPKTSKGIPIYTNQFNKIFSHISYQNKKDSQYNANSQLRKISTPKDLSSCKNLTVIPEVKELARPNTGYGRQQTTSASLCMTYNINSSVNQRYFNSKKNEVASDDFSSPNLNFNNYTNRRKNTEKNLNKNTKTARSTDKDLLLTITPSNHFSIEMMPEKSSQTPKYNAISSKNLNKKRASNSMFRSVNKEIMSKKLGKDLSVALKMEKLLRLSAGQKPHKKNVY